jgi:hypothetical protein
MHGFIYIPYLHVICKLKYLTNVHVCTCLDIDECNTPESYSCYGECKNTPGSFLCVCPAGYMGNASILHGCKGTTKVDDSNTSTSNNKQ